MRLRTVPLVAVAMLALPGCTQTVYYALLAPNQEMAETNGCFQQCQRLHSGQTKRFVSCVDTCPGSRVVKEHRCDEVEYERQQYGCTTMQAQALDGVALGLGIGMLVVLNVLLIALLTTRTSQQPTN